MHLVSLGIRDQLVLQANGEMLELQGLQEHQELQDPLDLKDQRVHLVQMEMLVHLEHLGSKVQLVHPVPLVFQD